MQMYYLDGFNQYQIAEMIGLSRPTVTQYLTLARKNIRKMLDLDTTKRPISRLYSEGYFSDSLLQSPTGKQKKSKRFMFLFEYHRRSAKALLEYLRQCFHDDDRKNLLEMLQRDSVKRPISPLYSEGYFSDSEGPEEVVAYHLGLIQGCRPSPRSKTGKSVPKVCRFVG